MNNIKDKKLVYLKPDEIIISDLRARKSFDEYELKLLADSICENGMINPIVVSFSDKTYRLISGERRLRASRLAGLRRVPCLIRNMSDADASVMALAENIGRKSLNFFEEAVAIDKILTRYKTTQTELALSLGMPQAAISAKLRLLRLDENLKVRIISAGLTEKHARELLKIPAENRSDALDEIIANSLSAEGTRELIDSILNPKPIKTAEPGEDAPPPVRKAAIGDIRLFENSLAKLILTMQTAGIEVSTRQTETEKFTEYKIKFLKQNQDKFQQLKIC